MGVPGLDPSWVLDVTKRFEEIRALKWKLTDATKTSG